jgi:hypothetical protein
MPIRSDMARIISGGLFSRPKRSLGPVRAPLLWKERRRRRVRWIDGKAPDSEEAEIIHEAIIVHRCNTYGDVTQYTATRLFSRDHAAAGWLADIGLFYRWYLLDACKTLERLRDRLVRIEDEASPWD